MTRLGVLVFAAAMLPAFSQQPDSAAPNQGTVNEQALRDAVLRAFALPKIPPVVNLAPVPARRKITVILPPVVCAVPLAEVPVRGDVDPGSLRPESAASRDPKKPVRPGVPSCADLRNR